MSWTLKGVGREETVSCGQCCESWSDIAISAAVSGVKYWVKAESRVAELRKLKTATAIYWCSERTAERHQWDAEVPADVWWREEAWRRNCEIERRTYRRFEETVRERAANVREVRKAGTTSRVGAGRIIVGKQSTAGHRDAANNGLGCELVIWWNRVENRRFAARYWMIVVSLSTEAITYYLFFLKIHTKRVMFGKWKNNAKGDKTKKTEEE